VKANRRFGIAAAAGLAALALPQLAPAQEADGSLLEEITISADRRNSFGADLVQAGTFRGANLIDTPLTVSVLPRELLDAQQVTQLYDALRNTAGVTSSQINNALYSNMAIRGIAVENRGNYRLNGALPVVNLIDLPMENKERVEVLKGVSALYYGFTTPSGIINLTSKRPPDSRVLDATVFGNRFGSLGAHVDYGDKFADGRFGVRVNALYSDLDIGVDHTSGDRSFGSVSADWSPTDSLKIELDLERIDKTYSEPTTYAVATPMGGAAVVLPPIPDPEKNLGGDWMQGKGWENNALLTARWRFARDWELSLSAGRSDLRRNRFYSQFQNFNLATGNGQVRVSLTNGNVNENDNYRSELSGAFFTGPLKHEVTFGFTQNQRNSEVIAAQTVTYNQNLYNPVEPVAIPLPPRALRTVNEIEDRGLYVFDRVSYAEWLQLLLGVRQTDYESTNLTVATGVVDRYTADETTPAFGLVLKPREWLSFYGTYIEGLEEGGIAGTTTVNAGEVMPANTSEQFELGVKAELGKVLLTLGYFDIDRASSFVDTVTNRFVQDGRTTYKGLELSATGEVTSDLSVYATAMTLDAEQQRTANAALVGLRPENTPEFTGSLFLEYRLPAVPGLALSAGAFYTGDRAINQSNIAFVGGYTTFDVGARYSTELFGNETTFRFYAENITHKEYWSATSSNLLNPNLPPTIKLSVTTRFGGSN
jgi:iron complex outermembrane receptor protein